MRKTAAAVLATLMMCALAPAALAQEQVPFPEGTPVPASGERPEGTQLSVNGCVTDEELGAYLAAIGEGLTPVQYDTEPTATQYDDPPAATQTPATQPAAQEAPVAPLPTTGGPALLAPLAGLLLLASGLVGLGVARFRS